MNKFIPPFSIIIIGIILFITSILQNTGELYPEKIFSDEATQFEKSFEKFLLSIDENIKDIRTKFSDTNRIKNADESAKYFLNFSKSNPYIISMIFAQNNNKIAVRKSDDSYIVAVDSTNKIDVIEWKRFKNGKQISSWKESFSNPINQSKWFKNLKNNPDKISWFFDTENKARSLKSTDNELFYAAFPYTSHRSKNLILLRFSRLELLKAFSVYSKYENIKLLIQTADGKNMNLNSGIIETFKNIKTDSLPTDSFRILSLNHFEKFENISSGIFNYVYKKDIIWNSFKKFNSSYGINFYILSIPNSDILNLDNSKSFQNILYGISLIIILLGLIFLIIIYFRKTKYKKADIPGCKEILEQDENRVLEFKSSLRWDYRQEKVNPELEKVIFKTIAAFGNTDGGILLIGVDDNKNILGIEPDLKTLKKPDIDFFEIHLRNLLHTQMGVKYVSKNIRMEFETAESDKVVCKIQVLAADEALFLRQKDKNGQMTEKFYVRSGNSSQEIKLIAEINDYINGRFQR